jgi:hypothetical protein
VALPCELHPRVAWFLHTVSHEHHGHRRPVLYRAALSGMVFRRVIQVELTSGRVSSTPGSTVWRSDGAVKGETGVKGDVASRAAQYDVAQRTDVDKLYPKAVGLIGVLSLTVTGSAPISAMLFNVPVGVGYGEGIGLLAVFLKRQADFHQDRFFLRATRRYHNE